MAIVSLESKAGSVVAPIVAASETVAGAVELETVAWPGWSSVDGAFTTLERIGLPGVTACAGTATG